MTEPDDFGLSPVATLARIGDPGRSIRHAAFWKTWSAAVLEHTPRLVPRTDADGSDPSATHEFESFRSTRIGCGLLLPKGRALAGLVALHGYENVPTLAQSMADFAPLAERGVAVLAIRVRGYPGSQRDCAGLVAHAMAPDGGGGEWITHGLEIPTSEKGSGCEWSYCGAIADAVNACRALRGFLDARSARVPLFLHGESIGGAIAITAASQLVDIDEPARIVVGLPSMGDWPWRLSRPERGAGGGAGGLIRLFAADHPELETELSTTLRLFDTVIHARRIHCPVLCKLALRDEIVPAPTAAAVFNALGSDPGLKWRYTVKYGHHDGGITDLRRHAVFDRLTLEFLDPASDPRTRDWESAILRSPGAAEVKLKPAEPGEPTLFGAGPLRPADDDLIAAYITANRTLDDLPYTDEFARIFAAAGPGRSEREVFHKLHNLRKAGKLPRLGKPAGGGPPRIDASEEQTLVDLVKSAAGTLGQRDQLPYSDRFAPLVADFNQRTGRNLSPHDVWRLIAKLAK